MTPEQHAKAIEDALEKYLQEVKDFGYVNHSYLLPKLQAAIRAGVGAAQEELAAMRAGGGPVARIEGIDEYGPRIVWFKHWTDVAIGTHLYARPRPATPLEEGFTLVAVKGFDDLMYWLDRCESKGHLENCSDLIEPWANFDYRAIAAQQGDSHE